MQTLVARKNSKVHTVMSTVQKMTPKYFSVYHKIPLTKDIYDLSKTWVHINKCNLPEICVWEELFSDGNVYVFIPCAAGLCVCCHVLGCWWRLEDICSWSTKYLCINVQIRSVKRGKKQYYFWHVSSNSNSIYVGLKTLFIQPNFYLWKSI